MSFEGLTANMQETLVNSFKESDTIEYRPAIGGIFFIDAIFDDEWNDVDASGEVDISTTQPNIGIIAKDLEVDPRESDIAIIRGKTYRVIDVRPDGRGMIDLFLNEVVQ